MDLNTPALKRLLDTWLDEDIGRGDLTKEALQNFHGQAHWVAKQKGVFCGGALVEKLFQRLNESVQINLLVEDGESFDSNQKLLTLHGPAATLVAGERTALNIAMHLSGIATETAKLVSQLKGTGVQLADTRKTTPGLRIVEKYAVRCGGGINHRLGLDDAAMLKENHLAWSDDMNTTFQSVRESAPWPTRIIIEAETPEQAEEAVKAGADGILLDELSPQVLHKLIPHLRDLASSRATYKGSKQIVIEASGVNPVELKEYADTGVDFISSSAPITKSSWIDISMRFEQKTNVP